jgi:hypothetical protein
MMRRLILAALLLATTTLAEAATSYTDVWFDVNEQGWGMFLVQSNTFQFVAFFIYDSNGNPIWYTAQLNDDGTGKYAGTLYATTGTYFVNPWQGYNATPAGTATFTPSDIYHATLTYTVTGVGTATKPLQRQTLTSLVLGGSYSGSVFGTDTSCANPADNNAAINGRFNLTVAQNGDVSATLTFTFVDATYSGMVCTWTGPLNHLGALYQIAAGQYSCTMQGFSSGTVTSGTLESLHPTGQGIEGRWVVNKSTGCVETIHFAAVIK